MTHLAEGLSKKISHAPEAGTNATPAFGLYVQHINTFRRRPQGPDSAVSGEAHQVCKDSAPSA